jgi:hypothetical protein
MLEALMKELYVDKCNCGKVMGWQILDFRDTGGEILVSIRHESSVHVMSNGPLGYNAYLVLGL